MAYDAELARRVRALLESKPGFSEKRMFGGVCCLLRGNMACGVLNDDLIVRVGSESHEDSLKLSHTRVFDLTGKPMKGWVVVSAEGLETEEGLATWVERGAAYALALPPK